MKHFTHFFRVLTLCLVTLVSSGAWATVQTYQKVTSAPTDWSGEYLIVYEAGNCAMDGSLTTLDAVSNTQAVTITDNTISLDDSYSFTIAPMDGGYSIQANSGKYIGNASNSNALTSSDNALANTLSLSADGDVLIVSSGGAYLRYNATSGQTRFRYYKSSSYSNQKAIHLYKKSTTPPTDVLKSLTVSGTPTKTTYEAGEAFDPAGLTVTGTYSESGSKTVTSGIVWGVTPEILTVGTTSVSVVAYVGSVESSEYIVNGLTVNAPKTLTSIAVSGTPIKTSYYVGAKLDVAGLVATGTYSDGSTEDLTDVATWNFTPAIFDATGNVAVAVVATVEEISSPAYNVNVTVAEKPAPTYANTYTSGEGLLTTTGGTSASAAKVVIDETQYEAIKAGTGKVAGAIKMTVPAGTKTLHFHALGWNGETVEITVNGQTYSLTSDTGVSGSSPFTLTTDPSEVGYFTLDTNNATALEITFAATTDKRFVLFGVNAEASTPSTDPSIAADDVELAADATSGEIAYTITNPVEGQTLSATTEATWISNIQVAADKVTFTTTANTEASERTANITLKYEGATDKVVTVTQKGATVALTTIDQIFAKATEAGSTATEISVKFDGWYVTGVKGSNAYATDGTKGFIIYGNGHGFVVGDALTGTVTCKVQLFNGSAELTELTTSTEGLTVTHNHAINTVEKTIDQLSGINTGAVVTIKNITYDGANFTDGTNTIVPFNSLMPLPTFEKNGKYNITGVYLQYGDKKEILPRSEADIETITTTKYTITWSVNGTTTDEEVNEGSDIDFKPATVPAGFTDYVFRGWITNATVEGTTEPTYVTEATATADVTYYAVFAKKTTTGGAASLTKLDGTSTLADGDHIAIFASKTKDDVTTYYGMKHETVSNSYVNFYVLEVAPTYEAVTADALNWWTLNAAEEGKWTLGDAVNGYLVNASSNDLIADGTNTGSSLTIAWDDTNNAFTIKNGGRWIGCRADLTGDNQYKYRCAGNNSKPTTNSLCYLDIYRVNEGTVTYSDFTTTLVAPVAYTLEVSKYGYSTLYLDKAVEIPEGVTVYYCTTKDDQSLNAVKIDGGYIPARTGVVVETNDKEAGTYEFEYTDQQIADFEKSELSGVLGETPVLERRHHGESFYVLSIVDGKVGFYMYADDATLQANRAFLVGNEDEPPSVSGFILDFGMETVGVSTVVNATNLKAGYDLTGRKVVKSGPHGIFLQKGRKLIR